MKRTIRFTDGIIGGVEMKAVVEILPKLEGSFRQRKTYFEYYFDETEIEITLEQLDELSKEFTIKINWDDITINV
jgi:hypothetical protein